MSRAVLFVFLILSPRLHATVEDENCEKQVLVARYERAGQFIFGRSSLTNLSLLRNYEEIDSEVVKRFQQEVQAAERFTLPQSHFVAKEFHANPTEANRLKLFNATKIVAPIASRLLLKRFKSAGELEDYLQTGYLGVWSEIGLIPRIKEEKISSLTFWSSLLNNLRREAFNQMRAEFRKQYSLTPVSFNEDQSDKFTFEEEILLFGDTPSARADIAHRYRKSPGEAEAEWHLQQDSIFGNELKGEASLEPEFAIGSSHDQEIRNAINTALNSLPPRQERAIRETIMRGSPVSETAAKMGVIRQKVESLVAGGLRNLRRPTMARPLRPYADYTPPSLKPKFTLPPSVEFDVLLEQQKKQRAELIREYLRLRKIENTASINILKKWRMAGEFGRYEEALRLFLDRNRMENEDNISHLSLFQIQDSVQRMRILAAQLENIDHYISEEFLKFPLHEIRAKIEAPIKSAFAQVQVEAAANAAYRQH